MTLEQLIYYCIGHAAVGAAYAWIILSGIARRDKQWKH